jgi:hypothetical protein
MTTTPSTIARRWDNFGQKLNNWFKSGPCLTRVPKMLIGALVLILIIETAASICGLIMLFLPRLTCLLILTSLTVPLVVIICTPLLLIIATIWPSIGKANEQIWKTAIVPWAFLLFFSGFLGFFDGSGPIGIQRYIRSKFLSTDTQFPISDPDGFAVDSKDRIYLAISTYARIQVYSPDGDFLRGWFVQSAGGALDIWIENNDLLHVCTSRTDLHLVFDPNGRLLESHEITSLEESSRLFDKAGGLDDLSAFGNTYSIQSPEWSPKVVKTNTDAEQSIVVQDPFYLWIVRKMQPLLLLVLAGVIISGILWLIIKVCVDLPRTLAAVANPKPELENTQPTP